MIHDGDYIKFRFNKEIPENWENKIYKGEVVFGAFTNGSSICSLYVKILININGKLKTEYIDLNDVVIIGEPL